MENYGRHHFKDRILRFIATMMMYKEFKGGTTRLCIILHFKKALLSDARGHSSHQETVLIREVARTFENGAARVFATACRLISNGFCDQLDHEKLSCYGDLFSLLFYVELFRTKRTKHGCLSSVRICHQGLMRTPSFDAV